MNYKQDLIQNNTLNLLNFLNLLFGVVVLAVGIINTFWGQPVGFGVFLILLSFVYLLPVNAILIKATGFYVPKLGMIKILIGLFIIWASLGVGELFEKIEHMMTDLRQ